jgi:hypothetical protein
MKINIVAPSRIMANGTTTFMVHLSKGLTANGYKPRIIHVSKNTEAQCRKLGWGMVYQNMSVNDVKADIEEGIPTLVATNEKKTKDILDELIKAGARVVIHSTPELTNFETPYLNPPAIVVRQQLAETIKGSVFLPHPYEPIFTEYTPSTNERFAICTARVTSVKCPDILLEANRLLPKKLHVEVLGEEDRIYTNFWLKSRYPEWEQRTAKYPKEWGYVVKELCNKSSFVCDMSKFKGDGGGTQYVFLEAIDGGACLIINQKWVGKNDAMVPGKNCLAVEDGKELAYILKSYANKTDTKLVKTIDQIKLKGRELLAKHDCKKVSEMWAKELCKYV